MTHSSGEDKFALSISQILWHPSRIMHVSISKMARSLEVFHKDLKDLDGESEALIFCPVSVTDSQSSLLRRGAVFTFRPTRP